MCIRDRYDTLQSLENTLQEKAESIQCVVASNLEGITHITFGQTQKPALNDYADGVDTIAFLLRI